MTPKIFLTPHPDSTAGKAWSAVNDWLDAEQHVERAHQLFEQGRWDEAESALRQALSLNPYQAQWHFNLGLTLEAAGRHLDAAAAFRDCFELQPPDRVTAMAVGVNLLQSGDPASGLVWLERAEGIIPEGDESSEPDIEPETPDAEGEEGSIHPAASQVDLLVHKIGALSELGRHEDAEAAFYLAQQHDAERADLYAAMADDLIARGVYDRAVWCLREAVRLDPELPHVQARLAEAYAATGRLERARQLYILELRRDPGDVDVLLDLGDLLVDMKRMVEASEKYRRVLELDPESTEAHAALGELEADFGRVDEAIASYDVVLRLDPKDHESRRRQAELLLDRSSDAVPRLGKPSDRARACELLGSEFRRVRSGKDEADAAELEDLGSLLLDAQMYTEAAHVHRVLSQRTPDSAQALHHLSVALLQGGESAGPQVEEGIQLARKALELEPGLVAAMHNLAIAHLKRGQWAKARYWVRKALKVAPNDSQIRRLRFALNARTAGLLAWSGLRVVWRAVRGVYMLTAGRPRRRLRARRG